MEYIVLFKLFILMVLPVVLLSALNKLFLLDVPITLSTYTTATAFLCIPILLKRWS